MTEQKYYRPQIEDFYVGFEYEQEEPDGTYTKLTVDEKTSLEYLSDHSDEFRVKRLDWDDLLSIGCDRTHDAFTLNNGKYFTHIYMTKFSDHNVVRIETSVTNFSTPIVVVHSITMNNKSDLLRLLKQLNILNC